MRKGETIERLEPKFYLLKYRENQDRLNHSSFAVYALSQVTLLISDGTHFTPQYKEYGVKFLSVKDVRAFEVDYSNSKFISEEEANILDKRCKPQKGDVLLTKIGATYGFTSIVTSTERFQIFVSLALLRPNLEIITSEFLELCLNENLVYIQFERFIKGAGVPDLHLEDIRKVKIPVPSLDKQEEITRFFNSAFKRKKEKENNANRLLASIDDYLLSELGIPRLQQEDNSLENRIFYRKYSDVAGGRADPYFHQEVFIDFFALLNNAKYPIYTLKKLSERITSGITPLSGGDSYTDMENGIPFVRSGNIDINGSLDFSDMVYVKSEIHNGIMKSSKLQKNDIMIAIVGATIGQVGIYLDDREANINQAIALVRLKKNLNPQFVKEVIKSRIGQMCLNRLKRPVARANINLEEISTIPIMIPPCEIQDKIVSHIQSIRDQAAKLRGEATQELVQAKAEVERMILGG